MCKPDHDAVFANGGKRPLAEIPGNIEPNQMYGNEWGEYTKHLKDRIMFPNQCIA